jgi:peptidyl-prolyl cis-trans isomerase A (cyclophilin A)
MLSQKLRASVGKPGEVLLLSALLLSIAGCAVGTGKVTAKPEFAQPEDLTKDLEPLPPEHEITDRVEVVISMGTIVIGLYGKDAPRTVENFMKYVDSGFYSGKIFHRVIPGFMIQGGGFDPELQRAPTEDPIKLEIIPGLKHDVGTVSMARTSDPHSATSQFFICVANAPQLNGGYAAFGKVESGEDVVEAISQVTTETVDTEMGPMADVPVVPVIIEAVNRL